MCFEACIDDLIETLGNIGTATITENVHFDLVKMIEYQIECIM